MWIGRGSPRSTQAASPGLHTQSQGVAAGDSTPLAPFPFSFFPVSLFPLGLPDQIGWRGCRAQSPRLVRGSAWAVRWKPSY